MPVRAFEVALEAARGCDLFLSVGTSGLVQPAASLALDALRNGAVIVEVNPNETPLSRYAEYLLQGRAGEVLLALVEAAFGTDPEGDRG